MDDNVRSRLQVVCLNESEDASAFIPLLKPNPARLSQLPEALATIEKSGVFSNFGATNRKFEAALISDMFEGRGFCSTVCNATIGLLLALGSAKRAWNGRRRYALMPAFTFVATAQAATWAGLTPLLCDIDPETWLTSSKSERAMLEKYGRDIAAIVACTTLGNPVDLDHYQQLTDRYGCRVVVDAASALGTTDAAGRHFGIGCPSPVVFSMHATKAFATAEGGVVYSADDSVVEEFRSQSNFGLTDGLALNQGLNGKLGEVSALLALNKLTAFKTVVAHRFARYNDYLAALPEFQFQRFVGTRFAPMFVSVLLPLDIAPFREEIRTRMKRMGVGTGVYFHPHLAHHPAIEAMYDKESLSGADDVSRRVLALPMNDFLTCQDVLRVASVLRDCCAAIKPASRSQRRMLGLPVANVQGYE